RRSRVPVYRSAAVSSMEAGLPWRPVLGPILNSGSGRGNAHTIAPTHQNAVLGPPQVGNAPGKPDSGRRQRHGEGEGCDVGEHSVTEIVRLLARPLVAGEV